MKRFFLFIGSLEACILENVSTRAGLKSSRFAKLIADEGVSVKRGPDTWKKNADNKKSKKKKNEKCG